MSDGFYSLAEIFKKESAFDGLRKKIKETDVVDNFDKIFPDLQNVATPVKFEKRTLFLRVENPAWRSELKFNEKIILNKINDFFGEERIKYLKFSSK